VYNELSDNTKKEMNLLKFKKRMYWICKKKIWCEFNIMNTRENKNLSFKHFIYLSSIGQKEIDENVLALKSFLKLKKIKCTIFVAFL
jgi:hypothetical protein